MHTKTLRGRGEEETEKKWEKIKQFIILNVLSPFRTKKTIKFFNNTT